MRSRRLTYSTQCLTCEELIASGERAFVEHGVGAWHEDCDAPRNLRLYQRERDRGQHAGRHRPRTEVTRVTRYVVDDDGDEL